MILDKTHCELSRTAKITDEQARQIVREYAEGKRGIDNAERFGISRQRYDDIGARRAWKKLKL